MTKIERASTHASAGAGRGMPKDMKKLARKARKAGVHVELTGKNHVRFITNDGHIVMAALTPSNGFMEARRVARDLEKLGVEL